MRQAIAQLGKPAMLQHVHAKRRQQCHYQQTQQTRTRPDVHLHDYASIERTRSR